jgi:hypothetical protein
MKSPQVIKKSASSCAAPKFTNYDLPDGSKALWWPVFIPTYAKFVANQEDPWLVKDQEAVVALQKVWNTIYPKISYAVEFRGVVFTLVCVPLVTRTN